MNPEQHALRLRAGRAAASGADIPVPVDAIAQSAGYRVLRKKQDGGPLGFLARSATGENVIGLNGACGRARQRFALAHLLGHGELHSYELVVDREIRVRESGPGLADAKAEHQATRFAVELLMPAGPVLDRAGAGLDGRPDREELVKHLAAQFDVSYEAMAFRLVDLAVIVP